MSLGLVAFYLIFSSSALASDSISITAVGDVMLGTTHLENIFEPALPWLRSDVRFLNYEGTFFDGPPQPDGKVAGPNRWLFKTPPAFISVIKEAGFNMVSLANNHVRDFGTAGLASTKETFSAANILYSSKYGEQAKLRVGKVDVVMLAVDYYAGLRSIVEPASTFAEIKALKERDFIVLVSGHVGAEGAGAQVIPEGPEQYLGESRGDSVAFARGAIDAGADAIIMHGPHVPRAFELYRGRLIIYSLGNFMTGAGISLEGISKLAPLVRFEMNSRGEFERGQVISFVQKRSPQRLELDPEVRALEFIRNSSRIQFPASPLVFQDDGTFR